MLVAAAPDDAVVDEEPPAATQASCRTGVARLAHTENGLLGRQMLSKLMSANRSA